MPRAPSIRPAPSSTPFLDQDTAARLAEVLRSVNDAVVTVDETQRILFYNPAAERIFGWPASEMLGQPLARLIPERFHAAHAIHVERFGTTGTTARRMSGSALVYGHRANGEEFPIDASISHLDRAEGKLFTVVVRDVSERMRAKEALNAFAMEAHTLLEQEKSRIARELHDDLAQSLTALKMDINWVRERYQEGSAQVAAKLDEMRALVDQTVAATRRIAADLRPLLLDDLGLVPAIEWLVQNFIQRSGVPCKLVTLENIDLAEPYATATFRIAQEALANVAKHANASQVEVQIEHTHDALRMSIRDDGSGFSEDAPRKPNSLGLMGLRERAHLLKGFVKITSAPGAGTLVEVSFPVPLNP